MMNDLFTMNTGCVRQSSNAEHSALCSLAQNFAAIDFETANCRRSSVCNVGMVIVRGGEIVDKFYSLIRPESNYYTYWTTEVHGLTRRDTDAASCCYDMTNHHHALADAEACAEIANKLF